MINRTVLLTLLLTTIGLCDISGLGGFELASSLTDVREKCLNMELKNEIGSMKTYMANTGTDAEVKLTFYRDKLQAISIVYHNRTHDEYLELVDGFSKAQGRKPDITNIPGVMSGYSSNWNSELTNFMVYYNIENNRLLLSLNIRL